MTLTCLVCGIETRGRSDKKFCSLACKNAHNAQQRSKTEKVTRQIDGILHNNRRILVQFMGDAKKKDVSRFDLDKLGFSFKYVTEIFLNKHGKTYCLVYDFAYIELSSQEIQVVRK